MYTPNNKKINKNKKIKTKYWLKKKKNKKNKTSKSKNKKEYLIKKNMKYCQNINQTLYNKKNIRKL